MLATPVDFRRADGPGPVREVPIARAGPDGYSTAGPTPLTQIPARPVGQDDEAARVGLTRFGRVMAPYAFCDSEVPIAEGGEGVELVALSAPAIPGSDGPGGEAPHPLAMSLAAEAQAAGDDRALLAAFPAPFGPGPSSALPAWPAFLGQLGGPASDPAVSPESWFWLMPESYPGASGIGGVEGGGGSGGVARRSADPETLDPARSAGPSPGPPVDPSTLAAAAPEPSGWMLLLAGFGGLGGLARRRRVRAASASSAAAAPRGR